MKKEEIKEMIKTELKKLKGYKKELVNRIKEENNFLSVYKRVLIQYKKLTDKEDTKKFEMLLFNLFLINFLINNHSSIEDVSCFCENYLGLDGAYAYLMKEFSERNYSPMINGNTVDIDFVFNWIKKNKLEDDHIRLVTLSYICKFFKEKDTKILQEYTTKFKNVDNDMIERVMVEFFNDSEFKGQKVD